MSTSEPGQVDERSSKTKPRRLRPGDRVCVVAPAGPVPSAVLDKGLAILESWDLEVHTGDHVRDRHPTLDYLAGSDVARAEDLMAAWCDPSFAAVLCARGGYGAMRVLGLLDWDAMAAVPPKVFAGSSDITALHQAFARHLGIPTVFGAMVGTSAFVDDPVAQVNLRRMLFEPDAGTLLTGPAAEPLVPGRARGRTVGGNLSLVASGLGTPDAERPSAGAIALLEDVTEEPYRLDRYLTQLRRAGWFDGLGGVALGSWVDCGDMSTVRQVLVDRLADLGLPIIWELGFGHCQGQLAVPLGTEVELVSEHPVAHLTLAEAALR
jgi:muramoyltetrapeptide carboxypeptidase